MVQNLRMRTAPPLSSSQELLRSYSARNRHPLKRSLMPSQPISRKSAPKSKAASRASCPPSSNQDEDGSEEDSCQQGFEATEPFSRSTELARKLTHISIDFICLHGPLQHTCVYQHLSFTGLQRRQLQRGHAIQSEENRARSALRRLHLQGQPDLPPSASRKRSAPETAAPETQHEAGQGASTKRTRSRIVGCSIASRGPECKYPPHFPRLLIFIANLLLLTSANHSP